FPVPRRGVALRGRAMAVIGCAMTIACITPVLTVAVRRRGVMTVGAMGFAIGAMFARGAIIFAMGTGMLASAAGGPVFGPAMLAVGTDMMPASISFMTGATAVVTLPALRTSAVGTLAVLAVRRCAVGRDGGVVSAILVRDLLARQALDSAEQVALLDV